MPTCLAIDLVPRMEMPHVGEGDLMTFDWDDEDIADSSNYSMNATSTTTNLHGVKTSVEPIIKALDMHATRSEALSVSRSLAYGRVTVSTPTENSHLHETLQEFSNKQLRNPITITASTLIFANTVKAARYVHYVLKEASVDALLIHGLTEPDKRREILSQFAAGKVMVLVATPVISRGIDLPKIRHVINFDFPLDTESYIHQAGRTARCSASGLVTTIVTRKDLNKSRGLRMGDVSTSPLPHAAGRVCAPTLGHAFWGQFGLACEVQGVNEYSASLLESNKQWKAKAAFENTITSTPAARLEHLPVKASSSITLNQRRKAVRTENMKRKIIVQGNNRKIFVE